MDTDKKLYLISNVISFLFYFFFINIIFNPYIGNRTIYLYALLPVFDIRFILYIIRSIRKNYKEAVIYTGIIFWLYFVNLEIGLKASILIWCLLFMNYSFKFSLSYLLIFIIINIALALVQAVSFFYFPKLFIILQPSSISKFMWGDLATLTGGPVTRNLGFNLAVSGLSREPGFFSSLIMSVFLLYTGIKENILKHRGIVLIILIMGILLSISKSTIALALLLFLYPIKNRIEKIRPAYIFIGFLLLVLSAVLCLSHIGMYNNMSSSWIIRTSGYRYIFDADWLALLKGIPASKIYSAPSLPEYLRIIETEGRSIRPNDFFHGLGGFIVHEGIISFLLLIYLFERKKVDGFKTLAFLLLTSTMYLTATTSYIILAWYLCFVRVEPLDLMLRQKIN